MVKNRYIVGIDPGIQGAICGLWETNGIVTDLDIWDAPVERVQKGKKGHRTILLPAMMVRILDDPPYPDHVFIEKAHAMPGQGTASMFSFGYGYGIWIGILASLRISYTEITSQAWKKTMMQGFKEKDKALSIVQKVFPTYADQFYKKGHIGRADAALIAEHGRRLLVRR